MKLDAAISMPLMSFMQQKNTVPLCGIATG